MRHVVAAFVASRNPPHFFGIISQTVQFSENVIDPKMCVLIFSTTFV
jgi:hypothetical protein